MASWIKTTDLVGLPGLPADLQGVVAWAKERGFYFGTAVDLRCLPAETRRALAQQMATAPSEPERPDAPEPWALMAVLSKVALAQMAGKGLRLTAEQAAILFAHLEERGAA
ncbi:hypothetical protein [Bosea vestrisii]|uniref:Uncharacterized protein n=1 Tax=Bosea vestrisii TaxID=151416 RepID=A0ABW0H8V5_9HYPH